MRSTLVYAYRKDTYTTDNAFLKLRAVCAKRVLFISELILTSVESNDSVLKSRGRFDGQEGVGSACAHTPPSAFSSVSFPRPPR